MTSWPTCFNCNDTNLMDWHQQAATLGWKLQPFIGGHFRSSTSTELFEAVNPATESPLFQAAIGSAVDVDDAVRIARQSFEDGRWSELPPGRRVEALSKLADL